MANTATPVGTPANLVQQLLGKTMTRQGKEKEGKELRLDADHKGCKLLAKGPLARSGRATHSSGQITDHACTVRTKDLRKCTDQ